VLYQPEIPPNTGNIIRLCANTGARLHLVKPLGFTLDDKHMRRAGLDYHEYASVAIHASWPECLAALAGKRCFAFSTKGRARYDSVCYREGDVLVFGPETRGLPPDVLAGIPPGHWLRLPMRPGNRSLNLSNAVAVTVFEAWRQNGFAGGG
jgi:tRNA (cytidine/uridine-2'-O-)-methyltransferase